MTEPELIEYCNKAYTTLDRAYEIVADNIDVGGLRGFFNAMGFGQSAEMDARETLTSPTVFDSIAALPHHKKQRWMDWLALTLIEFHNNDNVEDYELELPPLPRSRGRQLTHATVPDWVSKIQFTDVLEFEKNVNAKLDELSKLEDERQERERQEEDAERERRHNERINSPEYIKFTTTVHRLAQLSEKLTESERLDLDIKLWSDGGLDEADFARLDALENQPDIIPDPPTPPTPFNPDAFGEFHSPDNEGELEWDFDPDTFGEDDKPVLPDMEQVKEIYAKVAAQEAWVEQADLAKKKHDYSDAWRLLLNGPLDLNISFTDTERRYEMAGYPYNEDNPDVWKWSDLLILNLGEWAESFHHQKPTDNLPPLSSWYATPQP